MSQRLPRTQAPSEHRQQSAVSLVESLFARRRFLAEQFAIERDPLRVVQVGEPAESSKRSLL